MVDDAGEGERVSDEKAVGGRAHPRALRSFFAGYLIFRLMPFLKAESEQYSASHSAWMGTVRFKVNP